ncbi:unnamed protein product [Sympodiomycopsis kandeliae]
MAEPSSSSTPSSPPQQNQPTKRAPHSSVAPDVSKKARRDEAEDNAASSPVQEPSSEGSSFGASFEAQERITADKWLKEAFESLGTDVESIWKAVCSIWLNKTATWGSNMVATILEHLVAYAIECSNTGKEIPPRVWGTLFCSRHSTQKGTCRILANGQECWSRRPTQSSWGSTSEVRGRYDPHAQPFNSLRACYHTVDGQDDPQNLLKKKNRALYDHLLKGLTNQYIGDTREAFSQRLLQLDGEVQASVAPPGVYGRILPVVQSSGAGKTRLLHEMCVYEPQSDASVIFYTIVIRLGDAGSFPAADQWFLSSISDGSSDSISTTLLKFLLTVDIELAELDTAKRAQFVMDFTQAEATRRNMVFEAANRTSLSSMDSVAKAISGILTSLSQTSRRRVYLILAIDQAESLSAAQLDTVRRLWSPRLKEDGNFTWQMPQRCFLVLAGTNNQLGALAPVPSASGSDRIQTGTLYLPRPFTSFEVHTIEIASTDDTDIFEAWHHIGRPLLADLPRQILGNYLAQYFPSLGLKTSAADTIAILTQRIAFDLLATGKKAANPEIQKVMRELETEQVNSKFGWLLEATCRSSAIVTTTISEPIIAWHVSRSLIGSSNGWADLLSDLARLIYSFKLVTVSAGAVGEILTQTLCLMAIDYARFCYCSTPAEILIGVPLMSWLKLIVSEDSHIELDKGIGQGALVSLVRFRQLAVKKTSIDQQELKYLWLRGEGLQGVTGQPFWDQLVPVRQGGDYSYVLIQSKNQVSGDNQTPQYRSHKAFMPVHPEPGITKMMLYLEVGGTRSNGASSQWHVEQITNPKGSPQLVFFGNTGKAAVDPPTAERVFPVLRKLGAAQSFCGIANSTFSEGEKTSLELALAARAAPKDVIH